MDRIDAVFPTPEPVKQDSDSAESKGGSESPVTDESVENERQRDYGGPLEDLPPRGRLYLERRKHLRPNNVKAKEHSQLQFDP